MKQNETMKKQNKDFCTLLLNNEFTKMDEIPMAER